MYSIGKHSEYITYCFWWWIESALDIYFWFFFKLLFVTFKLVVLTFLIYFTIHRSIFVFFQIKKILLTYHSEKRSRCSWLYIKSDTFIIHERHDFLNSGFDLCIQIPRHIFHIISKLAIRKYFPFIFFTPIPCFSFTAASLWGRKMQWNLYFIDPEHIDFVFNMKSI